ARPRTGNSARALGSSNRSASAGSNSSVPAARAVSRKSARMSVMGPELLLIALDHAGVADAGLLGIFPGVPLGPALAEQIPALVEGHLDGLQAGVLGLGQAVGAAARLQQPLLLGHQVVDAAEHGVVVHRHTLPTPGGFDRGGSLGGGAPRVPRYR